MGIGGRNRSEAEMADGNPPLLDPRGKKGFCFSNVSAILNYSRTLRRAMLTHSTDSH